MSSQFNPQSHTKGRIVHFALTQISSGLSDTIFRGLVPANVIELYESGTVSVYIFQESRDPRHSGRIKEDNYAADGGATAMILSIFACHDRRHEETCVVVIG